MAQPVIHTTRPSSIIPRWGFGLLWLTVASSSVVFFEPAPTDVLTIASFVLLFAVGLRVPRGLGLPLLLLALLMVANILSILFAGPNDRQATSAMLVYTGLTGYLILAWLLFTSVIYCDPPRAMATIWNAYVFAATLAAIVGVLAYFHMLPGGDLFAPQGRVRSTFKDPNVYSPFLVPATLYLVAGLGWGGLVRRILRLGLVLLMVLGIVLGFSRGAWGNLVLSSAVFAVLWLSSARSMTQYFGFLSAVALIVFAALVLLVAVLSTTPQMGRMLERRAVVLQRYDVREGGRFSTQAAAVREVLESPLGIGPNRSQPELGQSPHNVYLKITAENGWLGGFAFIAFLGLSLWRGLHFCFQRTEVQRVYMLVFACVVGIVTESLIIDTLHWRHFFLLLALLWGPPLAYEAAPTRAARHRAVDTDQLVARSGV